MELIHSLFDQSPFSMWISDANGTLIKQNQACRDIWGITDQDTVDKYNMFNDPVIKEQNLLNTIRDVFDKGKTVNFLIEYDAKSFNELTGANRKQKVFIDATISPVKDKSGRVTNAIVHHHDITLRKLAEEELKMHQDRLEGLVQKRTGELKTSSENYHKLVESIEDLVTQVDREGNFKYVNKASKSFLGLSPKDCIGKSAFDFIHPDDREKTKMKFDSCIKDKKKKITFGNRQVSRTGEVRHTKWHSTLYYDKDGNVTGVNGIARDITKLRETEKNLQKEKENIRKYLNVAGVMLAALNTDGQITLINQKGCKILKVTKKEALGKNWFENYLPERMKAPVWDVFKKIMTGEIKALEFYENHVLTSEGEERVIAFHNSVLTDNTGCIEGVFFSGEDITERKKAEEALINEKEFVEIALDSQKDTFFVFDPLTGKALRWNRSFQKISGYSDDEIASLKAPISYYSKADLKKAGEYVEKVLRGSSGTVELNLITKNGDSVPTEYSASVIRDKEGNPKYIISIGRDVSERKKNEDEKSKLERQLRHAHKMEALGTLAGGISHDFNNILAAILGYTELAIEGIAADAPAKYDLEEVLKAGRRAKGLVTHILSYSRKSEEVRKPVKISALVKEALKMLRASTPTSIVFKEDIDLSTGNIYADPTQIHQVVVNLCTNAAHAMDEHGGILTVTLKSIEISSFDPYTEEQLNPGQYIKLNVSDTGHGIDPDIIERIFDPYFTTKDSGKGSGMGLAVIQGILKSHDATIKVESKPFKGSTFSVYFPKKEIDADAAEPENTVTGIIPTGTENILIVDDEKIVVDITKRRLETFGYHVTSKTSSLDALALFKANPDAFDLVITDQTMPQMTGAELAKEFIRTRNNIPIILCTGYSSSIDEESALAIGIKKFAMKPIDKNELLIIVRKALDSV